MADQDELVFADEVDPAAVAAGMIARFMATLGNTIRLRYGAWHHRSGAKRGQSLASHILDLASLLGRLLPILGLTDAEARAMLLALVVHDLNKLDQYGRGLNARHLKYVDAATPEHIATELTELHAEAFFPVWQAYLADIVWLAHSHQTSATGSVLQIDQRAVDRSQLGIRLRALRPLIQAADVADNIHGGEVFSSTAQHQRDILLGHINEACEALGLYRQFTIFGHQLAELRGIFTNVLHNALVAEFRDRLGEANCLDLLYFSNGVMYLLDARAALQWDVAALGALARRVQARIAEVQRDDIAQFIKSRPIGIVVDAAAMESGAPLNMLLETVLATVERKRYKADWRAERERLVRQDLVAARTAGGSGADTPLVTAIDILLARTDIVATDEVVLRRGEFAGAYRKFLEDHRADEIKKLKADTWHRMYQVFDLPAEQWAAYDRIDPFRRAYALALDIPGYTLGEMRDLILADLAALDEAVAPPIAGASSPTQPLGENSDLGMAITDYLSRNLTVWTGGTGPSGGTGPDGGTGANRAGVIATIPPPDFAATLRRYADNRQHEQCGTCGSPLAASEWMAAQVPPNLGVQAFSNRLEGGSARDPKRHVCPICRTQYILEKLAWKGHRDKQGAEQETFYLHLFPYAFFTAPLLRTWWDSVERLRDSDHQAFFLNTGRYYQELFAAGPEGTASLYGSRTATNGIAIPVLADAFSTTPLIPIVAPGTNYGLRFLLAVEKAVALAQWFDARVLLSRSPVPSLDLSREHLAHAAPVVLRIEGVPRNLAWLIPDPVLDDDALRVLTRRLAILHQLARQLNPGGKDGASTIPHDLAVAASEDPMAIFYTAGRLVEQKVAARRSAGKGGQASENQAIYLSGEIAPLLTEMTTLA